MQRADYTVSPQTTVDDIIKTHEHRSNTKKCLGAFLSMLKAAYKTNIARQMV